MQGYKLVDWYVDYHLASGGYLAFTSLTKSLRNYSQVRTWDMTGKLVVL